MDKLIRELREENEKLKKMFESGGMPTDVGSKEMSMYIQYYSFISPVW